MMFIELIDKIMSYYWSNIYYENVVLELKNATRAMKNMRFAINPNVLQNIRNMGKSDLNTYNNLFESIHKNKGLRMFLQRNDNNLHRIDGSHLKVPYKYLCMYCCSMSGYMRFYMCHEFLKLIPVKI